MDLNLLSTVVLVAIFTVLVGFQFALAAGVPWGLAAYGGANRELSSRLRFTSAIAVIIWLIAIVLVIRRFQGKGLLFLSADNVSFVLWILAAYLVIGTVMNGISRSKIERNLWTPVTAVALVALVILNMQGD